MRITKFVRTAAVGLVLGLLTGWLFSVAVPSTAQTGDLSWCLAQHTGNFDIVFGGSKTIWPGTSDGRYALVTVVALQKDPKKDARIDVLWEDEGENALIISVGNTLTVWAQSVKVKALTDNVMGQYTITFNLCGL